MFQDFRHAARALRRSPGLTTVAVLTFAVGIGLTAGMFSIVYGALWRGMPFEAADRLVAVQRTDPAHGQGRLPVMPRELAEYQTRSRSFEALAAWADVSVNVSGSERPERVDGARVSADAFRIVRVRPLLGRDFVPDDERVGAPAVAIIGYALWRDRYRGDPAVVGSTIRADGVPTTVIGVMPSGFRFPDDNEIWLPLRQDPLRLGWDEGQPVEVFGRLRDGVPLARADAEIAAIQRSVAAAHATEENGAGARVLPILGNYMGAPETQLLLTMLGAVALVLLVACFNVANLLLSRTLVRTREIGIRAALGAGRRRIALQFLMEAFILALLGSLPGIAIAWAGIRVFNAAIAGTRPPFYLDFRLDAVPILFTVGLAGLAALLAGLLPALRAARANVADVLKDESRGGSSFRLGRVTRGLVVLEMALSCALLVAAGLTVKSVMRARHLDLGIPVDQILTARVTLPEATYPDAAAQDAFWTSLLARLRALPGVREAALGTVAPGLGSGRGPVAIEGRSYTDPRDVPLAHFGTTTPGYFAALGLAPIEGRDFGPGDVAASLPVALVNRSFARRRFPDGALGQRVLLRVGADSVWRTIVGVMPDAYANQIGAEAVDPPDAVYLPLAQHAEAPLRIVLRTAGAPLALSGPVRDAVTALDPDLPIYNVDVLGHAIHVRLWFVRVFGGIFMVFGTMALFLAAVGLYAVMAFAVRRRSREMGIRMAIGAQPRDVLRLVLRQGMTQAAVGLAIGLVLALGLSRLASMILFGVEPQDPVVFAAITMVLTATAAVASVVPALRATRVHPTTALRLD